MTYELGASIATLRQRAAMLAAVSRRQAIEIVSGITRSLVPTGRVD